MRDVENTLRYLRDDGVIVLHDRNPANGSIACPAPSFADFCAQNHERDFFQHLRLAETARVQHLDLTGMRGRDQGHPVDGGRLLTPMIAGAAVVPLSGAGVANNPQRVNRRRARGRPASRLPVPAPGSIRASGETSQRKPGCCRR